MKILTFPPDLEKSELLKVALRRWHRSVLNIKKINNGVFQFQHNEQVFYLHLQPQPRMSFDRLNNIISFQQHLERSHIAVPAFTTSLQDQWIEKIEDENFTWFAYVNRFIPGRPIRFKLPTPRLFFIWGRTLAQFHQASLAFKTQNFSSLLDLEHITNSLIYKGIKQEEDDSIIKETQEIKNFLHTLAKPKDKYLITHGDHCTNNVFFDKSSYEKKIYFFDFEHICYSWIMDDISRPFFSEIIRKRNDWKDKIFPYLRGYQSIQSLNSFDIEIFSWFLRCKALRMYFWLKLNLSKNPEAPQKIHDLFKLIQEAIRNRTLELNIEKPKKIGFPPFPSRH